MTDPPEMPPPIPPSTPPQTPSEAVAEPADGPTAASPLARRLESARQDLLQLSTRNRLLSTPRRRKRAKAVEVVEEKSDEIFKRLVDKGNALTFEPAAPEEQALDETKTQADEPAALPEVEEGSAGEIFRQPEDAPGSGEVPPEGEDELPGAEIDPKRYTDRKLQTTLKSADLQKRLLRMFYDARSSEQEQGVNTLYLALGFLKWYEDDTTEKARYAPLLLVPANLQRKNARTRFSLRYDEGEITTNLSLQAKLRAEYRLELPEVPELDDEFTPGNYFEKVREMVAGVPRWEVLDDDVVLSFFSFSKFLMYRDLDADSWAPGNNPENPLTQHPLLEHLLGDAGFPTQPPVIDDSAHLDDVIGPEQMIHVVPADTSQSIAVESVRLGRNLVVQGPPGTGKSQTIANLIAAAVKEGKKVLFVAEKMAALEVVKRRLTNVGLGDMCLELHSHKAKKRAVLDDLEHTLALGGPKEKQTETYFEKLAATRDELNRHAEALHTPIGDSGLTPYAAIGRLVELRAAGVSPTDFDLDAPVGWTADQAADARRRLEELLEQVEVVGVAADHPWRGAGVESMLPMDLERLAEKLRPATKSLQAADEKVRALADALHDDGRATARHAELLAGRARRLAEAPPMDRAAITNDVWAQQASAVDDLVEQGLALAAVRQQLDGVVSEAAWAADLTQTRLDLAAYGKSWLRWLNGAYKRAKRQLAGVLAGPPPKALEDRLQLVDQILEAQKAIKNIERDDAIGRYAFGTAWRGADSDWANLGKIRGWNRRNEEQGDGKLCRQLIATLENVARLPPAAGDAERAVASAARAFEGVVGPVELDLGEAFGVEEVGDVPLGPAAQRLEAWKEQPDGLSRWISYRDRRKEADAAGLTQLVERLNDGQLTHAQATDAFDMAYHEALLRQAFEDRPELARFTGEAHEHTLEQFRQLDRDRLALARHEVATAHHDSLPRGGGEVGQVGLLRREFQKKRRHLPLRVLLREAGLAIQAIKPVFMMSPMSVAQYLEPGGLEFDLMLMDEASQVRPVDALGAVARCQQIVVVGDDKQLPPTRFFDSITSGADDDEFDTDLDTSDLESILGLCTAQNMPSSMLRWHYRSKHPSLIAVSNREFYDSNLFVIPSPKRDPEDLGLRFHHVTKGHFDRGGTATHRVEAQTIAKAVMAFAAESPELTLGVGAFSVRQRDAILDEIEKLRRETPEAEGFFAEDTEEPFFVKNLENIQGDERDVIFISVGYGSDEDGKLTMNFGPLSNDGGERRLNVLITRAKQRLEVFSSMTADDIDLDRVSKRGPKAFRTFLRYAQSGSFDGRPPEAPGELTVFEQQVTDALRIAGYTVEPRVGEAGFYVDLAVLDPDNPGEYLLGITCDGPGYGACRSARERDASREFILKMRGWHIHRLWEIDWFNRPQEQLQRILDAIAAAKAGDGDPAAKTKGSRGPGIERVAPDPEAATDRFAGIPSAPYVEAKFKKIPRKDLEDLDVFQRMELVVKIVEAEGPVHGDEIIRRAADIYNEERLTAKLSRLMESALGDAVNAAKLEEGTGFYSLPGVSAVDVVRSRADVESSGLRKPELLPPAEVRFALESIARVAIGVTHEDAVIEASRLLGFASTRSNLREVIERELDALVGRGILEEREGALFIAE